MQASHHFPLLQQSTLLLLLATINLNSHANEPVGQMARDHSDSAVLGNSSAAPANICDKEKVLVAQKSLIASLFCKQQRKAQTPEALVQCWQKNNPAILNDRVSSGQFLYRSCHQARDQKLLEGKGSEHSRFEICLRSGLSAFATAVTKNFNACNTKSLIPIILWGTADEIKIREDCFKKVLGDDTPALVDESL